MNNRKWNAKNPNQGKFERILCVCSAGKEKTYDLQ